MTDPKPQPVAPGVWAIDTGYVRPGLAAAHLLVRGGQAAFVDPGPAPALPHLLAALDALGVERAAVAYIFVTHVHLDHAGGAGALLQALPGARVVAHPRALRHLADPARLVEGTVAVYGPERTRELYGEVVPVPAQCLIEAADGFELTFGDSVLRFLDTPGHARHHYCLHDPDGQAVFTGDTFGIAYRELYTGGRPFLFPTTTPVQFDPAALHASVDRIVALDPARVFLMHYSVLENPAAHADALHAGIDALVALARAQPAAPAADFEAVLAARILDAWLAALDARGCALSPAEQTALLTVDAQLNAQGLRVWLDSGAKP